MAEPARKAATYEDLFAPGVPDRAEIVRGVIEALPAPRPRHSRVQGALARRIGGPFDDDDGYGGPGGWWIFLEVDVRLAADLVVRPDLSGWRRERLPRPDVRPIDVRPDWVCEILSPSNAAHDRVTKRRAYAEHGIPHYWIVDAEARTVEALALDGAQWREVGSYTDGDLARIAPFEAVELDVGRLFLPRSAMGPEEG